MMIVLFLAVSAWSATTTVSGTIARELIELGKAMEIYDGAFGKDYIEARSIHCTKTQEGAKVEIACQMIGNGEVPKLVRISSEDALNKEMAPKFRRILMEGSGQDRKINRTTKFLNIDSLVCSGDRLEHEFDDLESEPKASCVMEFSN